MATKTFKIGEYTMKNYKIVNIATLPTAKNLVRQDVISKYPLSNISKGFLACNYTKNGKLVQANPKNWIVLPNEDFSFTLNIPIKEFKSAKKAVEYSVINIKKELKSLLNKYKQL
jgi:hypothetical protein